jgi:hypothetical protein
MGGQSGNRLEEEKYANKSTIKKITHGNKLTKKNKW